MLADLKNNNKAVGRKQCLKAIANNSAKRIFIAKDSDKHIIEEFERLSVKKEIEIVYVDSKSHLGKACGIEVGAAVACTLHKQ